MNFPYPQDSELYEILKIHTREKPIARDAKLKEIASLAVGFSGADIELLCQRASMIAIREHIKNRKKSLKITHTHFTEALKEIQQKITTHSGQTPKGLLD